MANSLLGLSFTTPTQAIGSTEATNHPATNALVISKWARTFQTTVVGTQTLDLDLGATTALQAIFLNNVNFLNVQFSGSATQGAGTNLYSATQTMPLDQRVNRFKGIFLAAGAASGLEGLGLAAWTTPFNHRWLRITMTTPVFATSYQIGAVVLIPTMTTMLNNWKVPYPWTPVQPFLELPYPDGNGSEINITGRKRWTTSVDIFPRSAAAKTQMHTLDNLGIGTPFLLYENRGDPSAAYLVKRRQHVNFTESWRYSDVGPFVLDETI